MVMVVMVVAMVGGGGGGCDGGGVVVVMVMVVMVAAMVGGGGDGCDGCCGDSYDTGDGGQVVMVEMVVMVVAVVVMIVVVVVMVVAVMTGVRRTVIVQISFDETEMELATTGKSSAVQHYLIAHARIFQRFATDSTRLDEVAVVPAVLPDTTAVSIHGALMQRAGHLLHRPAGRLVVIQNSDTAASSVKVTCHWAATVSRNLPTGGDGSLPFYFFSNCMMHMMFSAMVGSIDAMDLQTATYCASSLLTNHSTHDKFRKCVRQN